MTYASAPVARILRTTSVPRGQGYRPIQSFKYREERIACTLCGREIDHGNFCGECTNTQVDAAIARGLSLDAAVGYVVRCELDDCECGRMRPTFVSLCARCAWLDHNCLPPLEEDLDSSGELSVNVVVRYVANYFNLTPSDIRGRCQRRHCAHPRKIAMYLARKLTNESYPQLSRSFGRGGRRDHTTILKAVRRVEADLGSDSRLGHDIEQIQARILSR